MRWDAGIVPGTSTSAIVSNVDFAPTLAAAAGVTPATPVDGLSLTRFFADPNARFGRKGILLEHALGGHLVPSYCGWRTEDELYVRWETGEEEYYRYSDDPYELRNVAEKPSMSDVVARYRSITRLRCQPLPIGMSW
jgi:arylsulfatase A-like enzyme